MLNFSRLGGTLGTVGKLWGASYRIERGRGWFREDGQGTGMLTLLLGLKQLSANSIAGGAFLCSGTSGRATAVIGREYCKMAGVNRA